MSLPDQEARDAAADPTRSVLLRAPAGSGKTGVLLLRFLNCLAIVERPEQILAITFTRKAAAEIRERILSALDAAAEGKATDNPYEAALREAANAALKRDSDLGWQLLQNRTRLRVYTIDSFCAQLVRTVPLLSGMAVISPTEDARRLYREALLDLLQEWERGRMDDAAADAFGRVLNYTKNRVESLETVLSNLLQNRDQWAADLLSGSPEEMAELMDSRLQQEAAALGSMMGRRGFDSLLPQLRDASAGVDGLEWVAGLPASSDWSAEHLPALHQLSNCCLTSTGTWRKQAPKGIPMPDEMKQWLKALADDPSAAADAARLAHIKIVPPEFLTGATTQAFHDFYHVLRALLLRLQMVFIREQQCDFGEIAARAIQALSEPDEHGAAIGDALLMEDRIHHVLVDEMQDTSVNQIRLLENLTVGWQQDDPRSIFLCGDLLQSIYLFRGAVPVLFEELAEKDRFAGRALEVHQLQANFRSAPELVEQGNAWFAQLFEASGQRWVAASAQRKEDGEVRVFSFYSPDKQSTEAAEADKVLEQIADTRNRFGEDHSIAVLVNSKKHLNPIIDRLRQQGIDFSGQDVGSISSTPAIRDLLYLIRALSRRADRVAWVGLLRASWIGLCWEDIRSVCGEDGDVLLGLASSHLSDEGAMRRKRFLDCWNAIADRGFSVSLPLWVNAIWHSLGAKAGLSEATWTDVDRVMALLHEHCAGGVMQDLDRFLDAVDRLSASPEPSNLHLMSVHKSKGLEFDTVIIPRLGAQLRNTDSELIEWQRIGGGVVVAPKPPAKDDSASCHGYLLQLRKQQLKQEHLRLLYVAFTRARLQLLLIGEVEVDKKGETKARAGSLLRMLWPVLAERFGNYETVPGIELSKEQLLQPVLAHKIDLPVQVSMRPVWTTPGDAETASDIIVDEDAGWQFDSNLVSRCIGTVYHEIMEYFVNAHRHDGLSSQQLYKALDTPRVNAALASHGCPAPAIEEAAATVMAYVANTVGHEQGRWMLESVEGGDAELALLDNRGKFKKRLVVDRLFIDGDDYWIIDYKTSQAEDDLNTFLQAEVERYGDKMREYAATLKATGVTATIRTALYFPAHQHLEEL